MHQIEIAAAGAGIILGATAALIWQKVSAHLRDDQFWRNFAVFAKSLLSDEAGEQFLRRYLDLLRALAVYVGRKMLTLSLAFLPVVVIVTLLAPVATREWNRRASQVELFPPQPTSVNVLGATFSGEGDHNRIHLPSGLDSGATFMTDAGVFKCESLLDNHAAASSRAKRILLASLGFRIVDSQGSVGDRPSILIIRPYQGDDNVLWPYLSDLEFTFYAALSLASVAGLFLFKAKRC